MTQGDPPASLPPPDTDDEGPPPIPSPPVDLASRSLTVVAMELGGLCRVSRFKDSEPHFGRTGRGRFDDPREPAVFGVCYLGEDLTVAFAETILRDARQGGHGLYPVPASAIERRFLFVAQPGREPARLADLRGAALRRSGLTSDFIATRAYRRTRPWALAIHEHPLRLDGILYQSRQVPDRNAVALFDRASTKLALAAPVPLHEHAGTATAIAELAIDVVP